MIDGIPLVDAHVHVVDRSSLKPAWQAWAAEFGRGVPLDALHEPSGRARPEAVAAHFAEQGADVALLFCEYSPKVTGIQPIEDLLPVLAAAPDRFRLVANLNPHLHHPIVDELEAQLAHGAVALKVHPVHGGHPPNDRQLYPAYQRCQDRGVPVIFHTGTSVFPGSTNRYADPGLIGDVLRDFPTLTVVLAHGGRGWWYDAAAFLALTSDRVWIDIAGLPPARLPHYYARVDFRRLARRFVFGTDWPGVPGVAANARAVLQLGLDDDTTRAVLSGNARRVFPGLDALVGAGSRG